MDMRQAKAVLGNNSRLMYTGLYGRTSFNYSAS